jgi:hypothetical protein
MRSGTVLLCTDVRMRTRPISLQDIHFPYSMRKNPDCRPDDGCRARAPSSGNLLDNPRQAKSSRLSPVTSRRVAF